MTKYARARDMDSWQHDPRIAARGFAHQWDSRVAPGNGEDAYIELLEQHLRDDSDVLDLGCGHGELTLSLATRCRSIVGVERDAGYLELARELAQEHHIENVSFFLVNLAGVDESNRDFAGLPLADDSIDLFVNRRGPILRRYLDEALRVARSGAVIVGLHPTGNAPEPPWVNLLPEQFQSVFQSFPYDEVAGWVLDPLKRAGISDYKLWWIDVPEYIRTPYELYTRLGGSKIANTRAYQSIESQLGSIIKQFGSDQGLILRHQRLLWQASLP